MSNFALCVYKQHLFPECFKKKKKNSKFSFKDGSLDNTKVICIYCRYELSYHHPNCWPSTQLMHQRQIMLESFQQRHLDSSTTKTFSSPKWVAAATWVSLHRWLQLMCDVPLCNSGLNSAGCLLVIFLYKSMVAKHLCHFASKSLFCSKYVTICGGISEFLFEINEALTGFWMQVVNVDGHRFGILWI